MRKILVTSIVLLLIVFFGAAWAFIRWMDEPLASTEKKIEFTIKQGSHIRSAARQMRDAGVPIEPYLFEMMARVTGKANSLKAGSFEMQSQETPRAVLKKIVDGKFIMLNVSIIEGWNFKQMRKVIDALPSIRHDTFNLSDQALMTKIGSAYKHPEGLFFPDTYLYAKNSNDVQIYQQAHQMMLNRLDEAWNNRIENLPYKDKYQALIMASIIEKETGQASERGLIAAVFINRLKVGMLLQTDPTVIYGMGAQFHGNIRKRDLQTDTPYNTYMRTGLPPTPIALPGLDSLKAALHPDPSNAYYFVARGDGTSQFSDNLDAHNRAVNQFQR